MPHGPTPTCLKCGCLIPWTDVRHEAITSCPRCRQHQELFVFAAAYRSLYPDRPRGREALPEEATCYFYPDRRADYVCALSGRFICEEAATDWEGQKVSVDSLLRLRREESTDGLKTRSVLYDDIAMATAIFPLLFWPLTLFSIPAVFYITFRHWKRGPTSIVRRSRWRYLLANLLVLPQLALWVFVIHAIVTT